jgi:hypothetical protein
LDKVSSVVMSFTELPMRLAGSISTLITSIVGLVANFIPNLIKMIPDVLTSIIDGLIGGLPDALMKLLANLPNILIKGLIDKLPLLVQHLVVNLITALPKIVTGLLILLIKGAPKIAMALVRVIAIELPKAIAQGLWDAFGSASKLSLDMEFDSEGMDEKMKALGDKLSLSSSKLFEVLDLQAEMRGENAIANVQSVIDSTRNALNWVLNKLREFGAWLQSLWDKMCAALKTAWLAIWDNIIKPFLDGVKAVFDWIWNNVLGPFCDLVRKAFTWILDNIITPILDLGKKIWDGFVAGVSQGWDFLKSLGTKIWEGLWEKLSGIGDFLGDVLNKLNPANLFSKLFDSSGAWGKGDIENFLSVDVPFMKFAQGGLIPGQAVVKGDSQANDRVLALLSPGEAVIPRSVMENPQLAQLVQAIIDGKFTPPKFGIGGTLGKVISGDISGAVSDVAHMQPGKAVSTAFKSSFGWMWDVVRDKVFKELFWAMLDRNRFHSGGLIPAFAGGGEVPIVAQSGEFVVSRRGVSSVGADFLNNVNTGSVQTSGSVVINKIEINAKTSLSPESIRTEIVPAMLKAIKRESQDGRYIIASTGVR